MWSHIWPFLWCISVCHFLSAPQSLWPSFSAIFSQGTSIEGGHAAFTAHAQGAMWAYPWLWCESLCRSTFSQSHTQFAPGSEWPSPVALPFRKLILLRPAVNLPFLCSVPQTLCFLLCGNPSLPPSAFLQDLGGMVGFPCFPWAHALTYRVTPSSGNHHSTSCLCIWPLSVPNISGFVRCLSFCIWLISLGMFSVIQLLQQKLSRSWHFLKHLDFQ